LFSFFPHKQQLERTGEQGRRKKEMIQRHLKQEEVRISTKMQEEKESQ